MRLRFRPLYSVVDLDSPFNHGWRYWVSVSGAAVLLIPVLVHAMILLKLIGLL